MYDTADKHGSTKANKLGDKRFTAVDPVKGDVRNPQTMVQYTYVLNNPLMYTDPLGEFPIGTVSAEEAKQIIKDNAMTIKNIGVEYDVDPAIIAGAIYTEQVLNYDILDTLFDYPAYGLDTSIGIGQVRVSTAMLMEDKGYVEKTYFVKIYCEWHANSGIETEVWYAPGVGAVKGPRAHAIAKRLMMPEQNIRYVGAYLAYGQDVWENSYASIKNDPAILGTLYNLGVDTKKPHSAPKANDFGEHVKKVYDLMHDLLEDN